MWMKDAVPSFQTSWDACNPFISKASTPLECIIIKKELELRLSMSLLGTSLFHSRHQSCLNYFLGLFGLPIIQGWLQWTLGWNPSQISALPCLIEREPEGLLMVCQASNLAGQCHCQQARGFQREEEQNHQQWSWKMVLLGWIHTPEIRIGGRKKETLHIDGGLWEWCFLEIPWGCHKKILTVSHDAKCLQSLICSPQKHRSGAPWPLQPLKIPSM